MAETVNFSLRLPVDLASAISSRAAAVGCTKAEAMCHYVRIGIQADTGCAPATRDDLAALRDQVAALGEFQKAQSIALMDGVRGVIASMPIPALPSGVPEVEARRMAEDARREGLAEGRESMSMTVERVRLEERSKIESEVGIAVEDTKRSERERARKLIDAARREGEADGYAKAMDEVRSMSPIARAICKF